MELSDSQFQHVMKRFPQFELSYETISHKKVHSDYDVCLAIPVGKKAYMWFTFYEDRDVCILLELNREKRIGKATVLPYLCPKELQYGTVIYGTITGPTGPFIIEDIFCFKGISLQKSDFYEKLQFLLQAMDLFKPLHIFLPTMQLVGSSFDRQSATTGCLSFDRQSMINSSIHHLQYRSFRKIMPYVNELITRKIEPIRNTISMPSVSTVMPDFNKPQYKYPTVFQVTADIQYDIYHLYAYGQKSQPVYYNIAYIPNYQCSCFMNGLFRNIRENKNLDYIEESDDEDDFQNTAEDRFVDLKKVILMECLFHPKFKRWVPMRVVQRLNDHRSKHRFQARNEPPVTVVHIKALTR